MFRSENSLKLKVTVAAACLLPFMGGALALTTTTTFTTQVAINASCTINSASTLDFGSQGILAANVDQTSTIQVVCSDTTPYDIGLDAGLGAGATTTVRKMTGGGATINYALYSDAGRTTVWGDVIATDTVPATGNGAAQAYTVYGRIPPQTTPAPNAYTDTVTVTVTY